MATLYKFYITDTVRLYYYIILLCYRIPVIESMATTSRRIAPASTSPLITEPQQSQQTIPHRREEPLILIRQSNEDDLDIVSALLAQSSSKNVGVMNKWKSHMEHLRIKSDLYKQLRLRQKAIQIGSSTTRELHSDTMSMYSPSDTLRILWDVEKLRESIKDALRASSEHTTTTTTQQHNNNCNNWYDGPIGPDHISLLQHQMVVAQDIFDWTETPIGFSEVSMLPRPSIELEESSPQNNYNNDIMFTPIISNVVVSPEFRRKGVATRMIRSILRSVQVKWIHHPNSPIRSCGLYVDVDNVKAISVYLENGFVIVGNPKGNPKQYYMEYYFDFAFEGGRVDENIGEPFQ